jgi:hypothetical protein
LWDGIGCFGVSACTKASISALHPTSTAMYLLRQAGSAIRWFFASKASSNGMSAVTGLLASFGQAPLSRDH